MFHQLTPEYHEICLEACNPDNLTVGVIGVDELEETRQHFGFSQRVIQECLSERGRYRNSVDVFDDYTFCVVTVVDAANPLTHSDKVAFFFKRNLFLMVKLDDTDGSTEMLFMGAAKRYRAEAATMEKVVSAVFESFIDRDGDILASMEFDITAMEEEIATGKIDRAFYTEVFERRKKLLILRNYYEQLIDIGEELQENENDIFEEGSLRYIAMFTGRVQRFNASVQLLRDSLTQLREAYQAAMDYQLNRVIKMLTVLATVYLPPTLIAGWYGMNFKHMPELNWWFGYPLVIVLSVLFVMVSMIYFKRKKML
ncbi:MAG TPA: CorA family divalent cation transporter [Candidatus Limiplasma sp.]|nr:CorA family divalent cation transporter [Candidatus Limiplasma sp.]HPS80665.1 CorA family divalent cation transporter [Candidatus Limiplasma sp.]